jgi:hypothetical protein
MYIKYLTHSLFTPTYYSQQYLLDEMIIGYDKYKVRNNPLDSF